MENELQQKLEQIVQEKKAYIIPSNIKTGVTIFGVTGNVQPGTDTSDANAEAWALLSGYTAYANGEKIEGNMKNLGEVTYSPSDDIQIIPAGYITGGTIQAADITELQEYEDCLEISDKILAFTGYTVLGYIEADAEQYINTGYYPNGNSQYELVYSNLVNTGCLFGAYNSGWADGSGFFANNVANYWFHYYSNVDTGIPAQTDGTVIIDRGSLSVGDQTYILSNKSFTVNYPLFIFAGDVKNVLYDYSHYRLHSFVIKENNVIKHNFIPVIRNRSGEIGLYDTITNEFKTNQGNGQFIAGPVLEEVTNG